MGGKFDWHQWKQPPRRSPLAQLTGSTHSSKSRRVFFSLGLEQLLVVVPDVEPLPHISISTGSTKGWTQDYNEKVAAASVTRERRVRLVFRPFKNVDLLSKDTTTELENWLLIGSFLTEKRDTAQICSSLCAYLLAMKKVWFCSMRARHDQNTSAMQSVDLTIS